MRTGRSHSPDTQRGLRGTPGPHIPRVLPAGHDRGRRRRQPGLVHLVGFRSGRELRQGGRSRAQLRELPAHPPLRRGQPCPQRGAPPPGAGSNPRMVQSVRPFRFQRRTGSGRPVEPRSRDGATSSPPSPLDDLVEGPVDFIKIDVEGAEGAGGGRGTTHPRVLSTDRHHRAQSRDAAPRLGRQR